MRIESRRPLEPPVQEAELPVGRKVFLAIVLSQLFSIALIFGWYFYALRSELASLTRQRAQEAVLQSIVATDDYFKPADGGGNGPAITFGTHSGAGPLHCSITGSNI